MGSVGDFWALVLGLMLTMFGGMALCYGAVKLAERAVQRLRTPHPVSGIAPPVKRAA